MAFTLENIVCDVQGLLNGSASMARGCEDYAVCVSGVRLSYETFSALRERVRFVGVTENFKEILRFYHPVFHCFSSLTLCFPRHLSGRLTLA